MVKIHNILVLIFANFGIPQKAELTSKKSIFKCSFYNVTELSPKIEDKTSLNSMFDIKNLVKTNFYKLIIVQSQQIILKKNLLGLLIVLAIIQTLFSTALYAREEPIVFKNTPSYKGADVTFLESQKYYPALMEKIKKSKRQIEMGMYLFKITKNRKGRA